MKKLFILCLAAIMTTSFFSCGNSSKENSKKDKAASSMSEQSDKSTKTQKKDDNKPTEIDIFEGLEVVAVGVYPNLHIVTNHEDSPYKKLISDCIIDYTAESTIINNSTAQIEVKVDIVADSFNDFLKEKNHILSSDSKTYEFKCDDFEKCLISEEFFTDTVKEQLINKMREEIINRIQEQEADKAEFNEILTENFGNSENRINDESVDTDFKNTKLFILLPPDNYSYEGRNGILLDYEIDYPYNDTNPNNLITKYDYQNLETVLAVFENSNGEKEIIKSKPIFSADGSLNEEKTTINIFTSSLFDYDANIEIYDSLENILKLPSPEDYVVKEIPALN